MAKCKTFLPTAGLLAAIGLLPACVADVAESDEVTPEQPRVQAAAFGACVERNCGNPPTKSCVLDCAEDPHQPPPVPQ